MRKLMTVLLMAISISGMAQRIDTIENGDRYRTIRDRLNYSIVKGNDIHNIVNYGAIGDDDTDNTVAIQRAVDSAKVTGGIVYVPYGIFKTGTINSDFRVSFIGQGRYSVLKSIAAEPLITSYMNSYFVYSQWIHPHGSFENLYLDGDSIGTIGFDSRRMAFFVWDRVTVEKFTTYGVRLDGGLIGSFNDCVFEKSPINVYADSLDNPISAANHVVFNSCNFKYASEYSVEWSNGKNLIFASCDFELNGTDSDSTTGCIKYVNNVSGSGDANFMGLHLDGCWFERNYGYLIDIGESSEISQLSIVENSTFTYDDLYPDGVVFKVKGATNKNHLKVYNCNIQDGRALIAEGANAYVTFVNSNPDNVRNRGGATVLYPIEEYGYLSPPSGTTPADQSTAQGWATIYVGGTEYRIKLYK